MKDYLVKSFSILDRPLKQTKMMTIFFNDIFVIILGETGRVNMCVNIIDKFQGGLYLKGQHYNYQRFNHPI